MDGGMVAVGAIVVASAGGEVEGTGDLLVEQGILHGLGDIGIDADGEFPHIAGAGVGVQHLIDAPGIVADGIHDLALLKGEADVFVGKAAGQGGGVVLDDAVHRFPHRRGVHLAVGDVQFPGALDGGNALDGKGQIGAGAGDAHLVRRLHALDQGVHGPVHLLVVQAAHVKVVVLEGLGGHARLLGHGGGGVAQHHPPGLRHPNAAVNLLPHVLGHHGLLVRRHVTELAAVAAGAHADIGLHLAHHGALVFGHQVAHFLGEPHLQRPVDRRVLQPHEGHSPGLVYLLHQGGDQAGFQTGIFNEHSVPRPHLAGMVDQIAG